MARAEIKLTTLDLLAGARVEAARALPYLAKGLWRLTFIESVEVPTFTVDSRWRVYCNPEFTRVCAREGTLAGAVLHEALHRILRHEARSKAIGADDHKHANDCQDCEINARIDEARSAKGAPVRLPSCGIHARDFGWPVGLAWEEYYRLPRKQSPDPKSGGKNPCSGGSGATGKGEPWELPPDAPGGVSEAEGEIVRAQVAEATRQYAEAHGRGALPSGILRWAEEFGTPPPVPWRELVVATVRYQLAAKMGPAPSYARQSRRTWDSMALPVHRLPLANVCIVCDTSGSMSTDDLGKIIASVLEAVEALGKITAVGCDSNATEPVEVRHVDDLREALAGGGGTDMRVGLAKAAESMPDAIVCVTDGETPWPDAAPDGISVTIVLTRKSECTAPTWAQVIEAID